MRLPVFFTLSTCLAVLAVQALPEILLMDGARAKIVDAANHASFDSGGYGGKDAEAVFRYLEHVFIKDVGATNINRESYKSLARTFTSTRYVIPENGPLHSATSFRPSNGVYTTDQPLFAVSWTGRNFFVRFDIPYAGVYSLDRADELKLIGGFKAPHQWERSAMLYWTRYDPVYTKVVFQDRDKVKHTAYELHGYQKA
ncbi:hypothetical protein BCV70DRAFT_197471 [Testicularia cyperi]|uniref:Uncharacterized protein n=1 Tax=Testicularia cyperi TaxID=1882483 RepID=A0A317XY88_9BASI|nr:hypothetical protein BCV70DRAFT_197471 [Testicularia cyperi]